MGRTEIMALIAQYLRKLPDLERFLGQIKATFQSSALLLLPLIGNKILKQRVSYLLSMHAKILKTSVFVNYSSISNINGKGGNSNSFTFEWVNLAVFIWKGSNQKMG